MRPEEEGWRTETVGFKAAYINIKFLIKSKYSVRILQMQGKKGEFGRIREYPVLYPPNQEVD